MILVIVQHCGGFSQFILSFHMPLFFIISGLVMKDTIPNNSFVNEVLINAKRLILPQLVLGFFECVFIVVYDFYETHTIHIMSAGEVVDAIFRWWFLLVMFQCRLLKWINPNKLFSTLFVVALVAGVIFVEFIPGHFSGTFFFPQLVPFSMIFILIGYYLKNLFLIECNSSIMGGGIVLLIGLLVILSQTNTMVLMYKAEYGNILLFMLTALIGSFVVVQLSMSIRSSFLQWFGMMSMPIYVLQFHVNQYSRAVEALILDAIGCYDSIIKVSLVILISITVCTLLTVFIKKSKYMSILFGIK